MLSVGGGKGLDRYPCGGYVIVDLMITDGANTRGQNGSEGKGSSAKRYS